MKLYKILFCIAVVFCFSLDAYAQKSCVAAKNRKACGSSGVRKAATGPQYVTVQMTSDIYGEESTTTKKIRVDHIPANQRKAYVDKIVNDMVYEDEELVEGFTFRNSAKPANKIANTRASNYSRR